MTTSFANRHIMTVVTAFIALACLVLASWEPAASWAAKIRTQRRHAGLAVVTDRYLPYFQTIEKVAKEMGLDPHLVTAVVKVESDFDPKAVSPQGAVGLMQLMPQTASDMGVRDAYDPGDNIRGGVRYLSYCLKKFKDVELALAAYNAGPGLVERINGMPVNKQTRNFVRKVMAYKDAYASRQTAAARHPVVSPRAKRRQTASSIHMAPLVTVHPGEGSFSISDLLRKAGAMG